MSEEWKKYPMKLPENLQKALENGEKLEYITRNQRTALEKEAFYKRYAQEHGLILYNNSDKYKYKVNIYFKKTNDKQSYEADVKCESIEDLHNIDNINKVKASFVEYFAQQGIYENEYEIELAGGILETDGNRLHLGIDFDKPNEKSE